MSEVILDNIVKKFSNNYAVKNINFSVEKGELVSLLGPSGCGKSTTLRMLAGFLEPDEGKIKIGGEDITNVPANKRDTALVFQNYALFPHMTVFDNIAFGLKMKKIKNEQIKQNVAEAINMVDLTDYEDRYPSQLSGGQQQRVALARALVMNPRLLLLDEPLSNLDAKLREKMRDDIRNLQKRLDLTTIFVTHDQEEALVLSDKIIVLNKGEIMQYGTPREIFDEPRTHFVADFIGVKNFYKGKKEKNRFITKQGLSIATSFKEEVNEIGIRSNMIVINPHNPEMYSNNFKAIILDTLYKGTIISFKLSIENNNIIHVDLPSERYINSEDFQVNRQVLISFSAESVLPIVG